MSEMEDRVAIAVSIILVEYAGEVSSSTLSKWVARAAIEAMREPTEAMVLEGGIAGGFDAYQQQENTPAVWQAMIDEALDKVEA